MVSSHEKPSPLSLLRERSESTIAQFELLLGMRQGVEARLTLLLGFAAVIAAVEVGILAEQRDLFVRSMPAKVAGALLVASLSASAMAALALLWAVSASMRAGIPGVPGATATYRQLELEEHYQYLITLHSANIAVLREVVIALNRHLTISVLFLAFGIATAPVVAALVLASG